MVSDETLASPSMRATIEGVIQLLPVLPPNIHQERGDMSRHMTAMLARRLKLRMKPGHVPQFDVSGTLGSRNGLPMLIEAR